MSDIFLSYSRVDSDRARALAGALEQFGWSVFWDQQIPTGEEWRKLLDRELAGCRCVVVAWSAASIASNWVIEEAEVGLKRGILVPVLIDPVAMPLGLRSAQALDLSGDGLRPERLERLARDVSRHLGSPPVPHPAFPRDPRHGTVVAVLGLVLLDYALLLYVLRAGLSYFVPWRSYLLSPWTWLQLAAPLVAIAPPARSALRGLVEAVRTARRRGRTAAVAASVAASLALGAAAWWITPRLDLRVVGHDIDSGEASVAPFRDVAGASIRADNLCDGPNPRLGCDQPLPAGARHYQLRMRLGWNRIASYRLRLEGDPAEVAFARVRVTESLGDAAQRGTVTSQGPQLELSSPTPGPLPLVGTVDVRLLCRQLPADAPLEPKLYATLTALEGNDDSRRIDRCWTLAEGRAGGPCATDAKARAR